MGHDRPGQGPRPGKRLGNQSTRVPKDQGTKGPGMKGPGDDQGTKGPWGQLMDWGTKGPGNQWTRGPFRLTL